MRIIIVGAGQVGSLIASNLASDHEVVVIDRDAQRIQDITYSFDVLAKEGDATSLGVLEDAGLERADLLIASTDTDETNLAICGTAKTVADPFTIARVKNTDLLRTWERSQSAFSVDFMVCSTSLTAAEVAQVVRLPLTLDVDWFANGLVQMAEFDIVEDSPLVGKTVREADQVESLTFTAILRDEDVLIPSGDSTFAAEDRVVVIGSPEAVYEFSTIVNPAEMPNETNDVFVIGGSKIGVQVARTLQEQGINVRFIEQDAERADEVAKALPETVVLQNDATDTEFLERENVGESSAVITALDSDQKNLLVSVLAKQLGADRTVAILKSEEYRNAFKATSVDAAVSPQAVTGEEISRFTREQIAERLSFIEGFEAEVIEIEVEEDSVLAGKSVEEAVADLPDGVVIGAIARDNEMVTPRGDTVVEVGDHAILFTVSDTAEEVEALV